MSEEQYAKQQAAQDHIEREKEKQVRNMKQRLEDRRNKKKIMNIAKQKRLYTDAQIIIEQEKTEEELKQLQVRKEHAEEHLHSIADEYENKAQQLQDSMAKEKNEQQRKLQERLSRRRQKRGGAAGDRGGAGSGGETKDGAEGTKGAFLALKKRTDQEVAAAEFARSKAMRELDVARQSMVMQLRGMLALHQDEIERGGDAATSQRTVTAEIAELVARISGNGWPGDLADGKIAGSIHVGGGKANGAARPAAGTPGKQPHDSEAVQAAKQKLNTEALQGLTAQKKEDMLKAYLAKHKLT